MTPPRMDSLAAATRNEADRGTGIVTFREWPAPPSVDTIRVWRDPALDTLTALFIRDIPSSSAWSYRVEQVRGGAPAAKGNVLEYGYEELGLPLDSLEASRGLARVVYALDAAGAPVRGWIRVTQPLTHLLWAEHLPQQTLFFLEGVPVEYHASPGRPTVAFEAPAHDYQMTPDSVTGDWLRVAVRTPHACSGEPAVRELVAWVRYLDPSTRRPRVWYHTRGC